MLGGYYFEDAEVKLSRIEHSVLKIKCELDLVAIEFVGHHLAGHQTLPLREMDYVNEKGTSNFVLLTKCYGAIGQERHSLG